MAHSDSFRLLRLISGVERVRISGSRTRHTVRAYPGPRSTPLSLSQGQSPSQAGREGCPSPHVTHVTQVSSIWGTTSTKHRIGEPSIDSIPISRMTVGNNYWVTLNTGRLRSAWDRCLVASSWPPQGPTEKPSDPST